ncbi:fibronectin type III domain-containing protein [Paenibacillus nasutitermitis]|uniref:Fibronectin type-III domain-containing protein n=1 Tax=Paenibacillus nasutitermitis TaxID=1652958 RepID=A0A916Z971_9BACL|nr:fibronectin type III domain-containing protein [Paenibacillus nasutitermitis]GGD82442.1 hypothetical protein GCM10010911_45710 [Paenibacillus nasutitermitis]
MKRIGAWLAFGLLFLMMMNGIAHADYDADSLEPLGTRAAGTSTVVYDAVRNEYVFQFAESGGGDVVTYKLPLNDPNAQKGLIVVQAQLNDHAAVYPVYWGGTLYRNAAGEVLLPFQLASAATVACTNSLTGSTVTISCTDTYQGISTSKTMTYKLKGQTLIIGLSSSGAGGSNNYAGFAFDRTNATPNVVPKRMTYAEDAPFMMVDNAYFMSTVVDKFKSGGTSFADQFANYASDSAWSSTRVNYDKNSAGSTNALAETVYVTVSSGALDTIYATSKTKSAHRDDLTDKVVWDYWGVGAYGGDLRQLGGGIVQSALARADFLKNNWRMDHLLMIDHQWQRHDYDRGLPEHYPANPMRGTGAEVHDLVASLKSYGWKYAFHEDYWYNYPVAAENKYWTAADQTKLAKNPDGSYRDGFLHSVTGVQSFAIRAERMKDYSALESAAIRTNYAPNAAYLDVNPAYAPDYLKQVTLDASAGDSRTLRAAYNGNKSLYDGIRTIYDAPLLGEGTNQLFRGDTAYAGYVDGVEREAVGHKDAEMMVDYELKTIRPLMANQGMGYRSRYFGASYPLPSLAEMDHYRAMSIAFGHTGFIGDEGYFSQDILDNLAGKEYYLMQALQEQYLDAAANVDSIQYWNGSAYRTLDEALKEGYDFTKAKLHIAYGNGLELYLNFGTADWSVTVNGTAYTLDTNGWVASNPGRSFLAYSALIGGHRVDYADTPDYTMADGRGTDTNFGTVAAKGMKVIVKNAGDAAAPVITDASVVSLSGDSAAISWTTDEPASAEADYGVTAAYGKNEPAVLNFTKQHQVTLKQLLPDTRYYVRARSYDIAGNAAEGPVLTFRTQPAGGSLGSQFSLTQGNAGWRYKYWNGTAYGNLSSNGTYWYLPSDPGTLITSYSMEPGASNDAVLQWTAPTTGWIRLEEKTPDSADSYNLNATDGVTLTILHNDEKLWEDSQYRSRKKVNGFDLTRYVQAGDNIYIRMNKKSNPYFDEFLINPAITYMPQPASASVSFSETQGSGQWYYRYWDGLKYADMVYTAANARWSGGGAWIAEDSSAPSTSADSARVWIASARQEVTVSGMVKKSAAGGDGVRTTILINEMPLWSQTIGATDTTGHDAAVRTWVEPGDRLVFRVNRVGTEAADTVSWNPQITLVQPFQSQADFSSVQGHNQWYYQKWDGTAYTDLVWDPAAGSYAGGGYLKADGLRLHPENGYDAVRKWVANTDGMVRVRGYAQNPDTGGDGVTVTLLKNDTVYWSRSIGGSDTNRYVIDVPVTVKKNDAVYIRVNKNVTLDFDSIHVATSIAYERPVYRASDGFSSMQGKEQWRYKSLSGTAYGTLSWNPAYQNWIFGTYGSVTATAQHPENSGVAVRQWTAPFAGKIRIAGSVLKQTSGGDGVDATIRKNGSQLWSRYIGGEKLGNYPESSYYHDLVANVEAGDAIDFIVDKHVTLDYDGTLWNPTITYVP